MKVGKYMSSLIDILPTRTGVYYNLRDDTWQFWLCLPGKASIKLLYLADEAVESNSRDDIISEFARECGRSAARPIREYAEEMFRSAKSNTSDLSKAC